MEGYGARSVGDARAGILTGFHPEYKDGKLVKGHDYGRCSTWSDHGALHFHFRDATRIAEISQRIGRENLAAEAQVVLEEQVLLNLLPAWLEKERTSILLCAGGVFLNVKVNQRLWYTDLLSEHWMFPNPGDGGLAAGAGLLANALLNPGVPCERLTTASFGPEFSTNEIRNQLRDRGLPFREVGNPAEAAIPYLLDNRVVAWFQGRLESGPRALGNRSILMDPRHASNKDTINAKVKCRETFRPFCPSILADKASKYLFKARDERFMMTSFVVKEQFRSIMPAVIHVDHTTRPQFVYREDQPLYYELIDKFGLRTGVFALLNTSFNIKGEPIVCTPRDAIRTCFDTGIDVLIIDRFVLSKPHAI
jgi:carbamoyltransferase